MRFDGVEPALTNRPLNRVTSFSVVSTDELSLAQSNLLFSSPDICQHWLAGDGSCVYEESRDLPEEASHEGKPTVEAWAFVPRNGWLTNASISVNGKEYYDHATGTDECVTNQNVEVCQIVLEIEGITVNLNLLICIVSFALTTVERLL